MAWMIPPQIAEPSSTPPGEEQLFRMLRDDRDASDWIVLHSLDVAEHRRRVAGEIDFVVLVPALGVLCLEVKSHDVVECRDGLWYFGRQRKSQQSPFRQVSQTMHSLRSQVARALPELSHVVFWSAAVFPYVDFEAASPEWHSWQVIDRPRLQAHSVAEIVRDVLTRAREYLSRSGAARWFHAEKEAPTAEDCRRLVEVLRPSFEYFESPRSRAQRRREDVQRYTERQVRALDAMEWNPRVIFSGPAGSGKTFLAVESTRRAHVQGRRVLLTCFNRLLGGWLKQEVASLEPEVQVGTFHQHLTRIARYEPVGDEPEGFWERELPERATTALLNDAEEAGLYDEVIIDEAQDLLSPQYLDVMDLLLKGGLKHGRWLLFGDFVDQNIYGTGAAAFPERQMERYGAGIPLFRLTDNCRNTPRIAHFIESASSMKPGYSSVLRPNRVDDLDPRLRFFEGAEEQGRVLVQQLEELYSAGYKGEDIAVLSPLAAPRCAAAGVDQSPWRERLRPWEFDENGHVGYCTIHAYKGMEAGAVIVTDLWRVDSDVRRTLFYVAASRAQDRLILLAHVTQRDVLRDLMLGTHKQGKFSG